MFLRLKEYLLLLKNGVKIEVCFIIFYYVCYSHSDFLYNIYV